MAKETIGYFQTKERHKPYNLYVKLDDRKKARILIGNHRFGIFFRFHGGSDSICINPLPKIKDDYYGNLKRCSGCDGWLRNDYFELFYPQSDNDIEEILNMIFPKYGFKLLSLNIKSRKEFKDKLVLQAI